MSDQRGVFRVNTYDGGKPVSYLVCALTDTEAVTFVGAQDVGGTSAVRVQYLVEVAGLDKAHEHIAPAPVDKAPFEIPKTPTWDAFNALQAQVAELSKQVQAQGFSQGLGRK